MLNLIDANGIQIQTYSDILNDIINGTATVPGLKSIYGADINIDSNSPDAMFVAIFGMAKLDILNLLVAIYDSFDPDQAVGVALDALAQLCGIARKGGSFTITQVTVTVANGLNLNGQDTTTPFTVADQNGNQFQLITSSALTTGDNILLFTAINTGAIQVGINTITVPVTIVAGVTAINNPTPPTQVGVNQESDSSFRIRRQQSVAGPSQGFVPSLSAALNNVAGVTAARVYENSTDVTDADSIPSHSIWVVVAGGADADIAQAIYAKRSAGCGMKGSRMVPVTTITSDTFNAKFDRATAQAFKINFHLDILGGGTVDTTAIKNGLVAALQFGINTPADITTIAGIVRTLNPNVVVSGCQVSNDGTTWLDVVTPTTKDKYFTIVTGDINIF